MNKYRLPKGFVEMDVAHDFKRDIMALHFTQPHRWSVYWINSALFRVMENSPDELIAANHAAAELVGVYDYRISPPDLFADIYAHLNDLHFGRKEACNAANR